MQSLSEILTESSAQRFSRIAKPSRGLTFEERLELSQRKAERYNAERGDLQGYDCSKCLNRGNRMVVSVDDRWGMIREGVVECDCYKVRKAIWRMKASGLESSIKRCKFDTFDAKEQWQIDMLAMAKGYLEQKDKWLYIGGQVGCGKTHICTAVCRELLLQGIGVLYMPWQTEIVKIKAITMDSDAYNTAMAEIKRADVLYIDDFFKPIAGQEPSSADIRIAYDLINYRYCNRLPTLISSEHTVMELIGIDEATGSRIYEMSKGYCMGVKRDISRNYRVKG